MGEPKGKIQAWTPELRHQAERVGIARGWINRKWWKTKSEVRIPLAELLEIKKRRRIGKTLKDEIYLQLLDLRKESTRP